MRKTLLVVPVVLVAVLLLPGLASAGTSIESLIKFGGGSGSANTFTDVSFETFIEAGTPNGALDVGDSLRGILKLGQLTNSKVGAGYSISSTSVNELTGVFQVVVTGKTAIGGGEYDFTFGVDTSWVSANSLPTGTMVALYQDYGTSPADGTVASPGNPFSYDAGGGQSADYANAGDGDLFLYMGLLGLSGEGWVATGFDSYPGSPQSIASGSFWLNRTSGAGTAGGWLLGGQVGQGGVGTVQVTGTTQVFTHDLGGNWPLVDGTSFTLNVVLPVPAAMWSGLMLLGALGLGRTFRRRRA